jgi:hypothetical protein
MNCRNCGLSFQFKAEGCDGATEAGRMEIRRRLEAERVAAIDRQARVTAEHFAELEKARRTR